MKRFGKSGGFASNGKIRTGVKAVKNREISRYQHSRRAAAEGLALNRSKSRHIAMGRADCSHILKILETGRVACFLHNEKSFVFPSLCESIRHRPFRRRSLGLTSPAILGPILRIYLPVPAEPAFQVPVACSCTLDKPELLAPFAESFPPLVQFSAITSICGVAPP
jgi:hypothetical protein